MDPVLGQKNKCKTKERTNFSGLSKSCIGIIYSIYEAFLFVLLHLFLELSITSTSIYEEMECLDGIIPPLGQQAQVVQLSSYIQIRGAEAAMPGTIWAPD